MARQIFTEEQACEIVTELARFASPSQVVSMVLEKWGIEATRQAIEGYNPTTVAGQRLSESLRALFYQERHLAKTSIESLGVAHLPYRLGKLQGVVERAEKQKNDMKLMTALAQAAKDAGGGYGNKVGLESETIDSVGQVLANLLGIDVARLPPVGAESPPEVPDAVPAGGDARAKPVKPRAVAKRNKPKPKARRAAAKS